MLNQNRMNVDPRNTTDFIEAYNLPRQRHQPGEVSGKSSSAALASPDQASFELHLSELRPSHRTSDSVAVSVHSKSNSSSIVTAGNQKARKIPASERCTALSFVRGRAELAASLAGGNVNELRREIRLAEEQVSLWPNTTGSSVVSVDSGRVFNDVLASSYLQLQRFQNKPGHCKPRIDGDVNAMAHVRSIANLRRDACPHISEAFCDEDIDEIDMARMAAMHTQGHANCSSFVSLAQNPSRLLVSEDDGRKGAKAIARKAKELHTYTVPSVAAWPTKKIEDVLARGKDLGDPKLRKWLSGTPTKETEVLFLGSNLDHYRTASEPNPYRPRASE
ncbi:hypothetical protein [Bradyrhizobium iriomotense]|uniref:hypothetical protein n=1 Tax=Bradyrhizobium iriomotense TaxID=441950 RepID=UPI0024E17537|nr:hypothetical protein [Bradyrhizobium iriomotense]